VTDFEDWLQEERKDWRMRFWMAFWKVWLFFELRWWHLRYRFGWHPRWD